MSMRALKDITSTTGKFQVINIRPVVWNKWRNIERTLPSSSEWTLPSVGLALACSSSYNMTSILGVTGNQTGGSCSFTYFFFWGGCLWKTLTSVQSSTLRLFFLLCLHISHLLLISADRCTPWHSQWSLLSVFFTPNWKRFQNNPFQIWNSLRPNQHSLVKVPILFFLLSLPPFLVLFTTLLSTSPSSPALKLWIDWLVASQSNIAWDRNQYTWLCESGEWPAAGEWCLSPVLSMIHDPWSWTNTSS